MALQTLNYVGCHKPVGKPMLVLVLIASTTVALLPSAFAVKIPMTSSSSVAESSVSDRDAAPPADAEPEVLDTPTSLPPPTTTPASPLPQSPNATIRIGFLPAMTANKGQSKHFVGAFKYALIAINQLQRKMGYPQLEYQVHDNKADTSETLRGMTSMYMNGTVAFIGPEDTCAIEARLAAAWNLPMIAFVSTRDSSPGVRTMSLCANSRAAAAQHPV
jgi:hypothetical protein